MDKIKLTATIVEGPYGAGKEILFYGTYDNGINGNMCIEQAVDNYPGREVQQVIDDIGARCKTMEEEEEFYINEDSYVK